MKRLYLIALLSVISTLLVASLGIESAQAAFGLKSLSTAFSRADGSEVRQAGSHPFEFTTDLEFNTRFDPVFGEIPDGATKDLQLDLPPGLVANPKATPRCSSSDFINVIQSLKIPHCANDTAVGTVTVQNEVLGAYNSFALWNLVPAPGELQKLGFIALGVPVTISVGINDAAPYHGVATVSDVPQPLSVFGATTTVWGNPVDPAHDSLRGGCVEAVAVSSSPTIISKGKCSAGNGTEKPFLTLPRSCESPLLTAFSIDSWQEPGDFVTREAQAPAMTGCSKLGLSPQVSAQATTQEAESGSGFDLNIDISNEGISSSSGLSQSDIRKTVVTMPEGMTANPSFAEGLGSCSRTNFQAESLSSPPSVDCPGASRVGTVSVESPILEGETLPGSVYLATPDDPSTIQPGAENPFDSLIALYIVIKDPNLGVVVKLAGKVEPDPRTGQLITTFDDLPQFPVGHFNFHFREGARSPLVTPSSCGHYLVKSQFFPWAGGPSTTISSNLQVDSGPGGIPCPSVPLPFRPGFSAGSLSNNAGSYSPFLARLTRRDGEQEITRFDAVLPPGVVGKIAGVAKCSAGAVPLAKAKTARQEQANPSCPASSQIGTTLGGAGVGEALTYVPGKLYLSGPVGRDPLSVIAITPALAGPFDAGTVVVHQGLTLDPNTAEVQIDGSHAEPIPHILKGIPLRLRDLRISVSRHDFMLNPTNCDPSQTSASVFGSFRDPLSVDDDVPISLAQRFQAANCSALGFKPQLSISLSGGTKRGDNPALKAVVKPRNGDANFGSAVVTLPHSAFLEQSHIRTVCTRVQFGENRCPKGSIYGKARAVSPLLDEPLRGPVYLRSSSHPLPDLVVALHGVVDVNLVGRISSYKARVRTSFESVPDAPISKFTLKMQGGKKGLIVNSRNLCGHRSRAIAELNGQNGLAYDLQPVVRASCRN
jgi:hypothetical protein